MAADAEAVLQALSSLNLNSQNEDVQNNSVPNAPGYLMLEHIEIAEKLRVFRLLPAVAKALGPQKTREKLIPLLHGVITTCIDNGEDEILLEISSQLKNYVQYVGEGNDISCLLPLLGRIICCVEETVVTEAACSSFVAIVPSMPASLVESGCLQLIRSIFDEELFCSSRKAGCRLLTACFEFASPETRNELKSRLLHIAASDDEIPLVRQCAIEQLSRLLQLGGAPVKSEVSQVMQSLVCDQQRVVRAAAVQPLLTLVAFLSEKEKDSLVQPALDRLVEDTNRDTRRNLADQVANFQAALVRPLQHILVKLMEDPESEVRRTAVQQVEKFAESCTKEVLRDQVLPKLKTLLSQESDEKVKSASVQAVIGLLSHLDKEECTPLVQQVLGLLQDATPAAKESVFSNFPRLLKYMTKSEVQQTIQPTLISLYQDHNWRVRKGIVEVTPHMVPSLTEGGLRDSLLPAALEWLKDPACEIRCQSCEVLAAIIKQWRPAVEIMQKGAFFRAISSDSNYHLRKIWLLAVQRICETAGSGSLQAFMPRVLQLAQDPVPNVRICAVRTLQNLASYMEQSVMQKDVLPLLKKLSTEDADGDVKYFAEQAIKSVAK